MGLLVVSGALIGLLSLPSVDAATQTFIQGGQKRITSGTVNSLAFTNPNTAGNLIVVYVAWNNTGSVCPLRHAGATPIRAVAPATAWGSTNSWRSQVFYAKNIAGGANTVTATFGTAITSFGRLFIHEYSGLDRTNPLDASAASIGTTSAMNSGSATTTNANDLIFGAGVFQQQCDCGRDGFHQPPERQRRQRLRTEDRNVTSAGSYNATATQNGDQVGDAHGGLQERVERGVGADDHLDQPSLARERQQPRGDRHGGRGLPDPGEDLQERDLLGDTGRHGHGRAVHRRRDHRRRSPGDATTALSARASDASNNDSACSNAVNYVEDSTSPAAPQITDDRAPTSPGERQQPRGEGLGRGRLDRAPL